MNLCRPLVPMPGTNCPAGSWACRIKGDVIQVNDKKTLSGRGGRGRGEGGGVGS